MHEHNPGIAADSRHSAVLDPGSPMGGSTPIGIYASPTEYLNALRAEYHLTIKVVAVIAEQLLLQRNSNAYGELVISDEALLNCSELEAWRDEATKTIHIKVKR